MTDEATTFEGWAILELMGHRRLAGYLREQQAAGAAFIRIDVPRAQDVDGDPPFGGTQFYAPAAVYCITPTTEETARRVAGIFVSAPVSKWELPRSEQTPEPSDTPWDDTDYHPNDPDEDKVEELAMADTEADLDEEMHQYRTSDSDRESDEPQYGFDRPAPETSDG